MSKRDISRTIYINDKKVSEKTIINWFKFLKQKYLLNGRLIDKFSYYYRIPHEKLGLKAIYAIYEEPKEGTMEKFEFINYRAWLYDPNLRKRVLFIQYLVPTEEPKQFIDYLKKEKCKFFESRTGFHIYSPLHKTINKEGRFIPIDKIKEDLHPQIDLLKNYIKYPYETKLIKDVKENPFLIPVLFEYCYENYSSREVWFAMKSKLNEKIQDFFKRRNVKSDETGIKKVQQTIKLIENAKLNHQTKVMYVPLEVNHHSFIYWEIDFKNQQNLIKCTQELVKNNVYINILPKSTKNKVFLITLGDNLSLSKTLSLVDNLDVERILFLDYDKSAKLFEDNSLNKFNYAKLFDPTKSRWGFDLKY